MQLTFLGTSAGKPTKERNVSALALEFEQDNKWYLFDCGEATQHQLLRSKLSIGKLDSIFITHLHGDHYYGLLGLLASKELDIALNPLHIYAPKGIKEFLECTMKDISQEYLGYKLKIIEYKSQGKFIFDKFTLKVLPLVHSIESFAFYIEENDTSNKLNEKKLRDIGMKPSALYGELKKGKNVIFQGKILEPKTFMLKPTEGRKIIIAGDNSKPDILGNYLNKIDLLVHECTFRQKEYDKLTIKVKHTTAKELGIVAQKREIKNLIATHISPRYNKNSTINIDNVKDEIKENYKGELFMANDFDVYNLKRDGIIQLKPNINPH